MKIPTAVECPGCGRMINVNPGKKALARHPAAETPAWCSWSGRPVTPEVLQYTDHVRRAQTVVTLASYLRDADPSLTWRHLERFDAPELRKLLVIALAAIDADKPLREDLYLWVVDMAGQLPAVAS